MSRFAFRLTVRSAASQALLLLVLLVAPPALAQPTDEDPRTAAGPRGAVAWTDTPRALTAVLFLAAIGAIAWIGRDTLPSGVSSGIGIAAISGVIVLLGLANVHEAAVMQRLRHVLAGLTVFWLIVATTPGAIAAAHAATRQLAAEAAGLCGLLATLAWIAGRWDAAGFVDLVVLIVAGVLAWRAGYGIALYGVAALLAVTLWSATSRWVAEASPGWIGVSAVVVGLAALAATAGPVGLHWYRQRRAWFRNPQTILELAPPPIWLHGATVAALVLVLAAAIIRPTAPMVAWALLGAGSAGCTMCHRGGRTALGALGLAGFGGSIIAIVLDVFGAESSTLLLALALVGMYFIALGQYWARLRALSETWTTAARLAPHAQRLGVLAVLAATVLVLATPLFELPPPAAPAGYVAAAMLAIAGGLQWRTVHTTQRGDAILSTAIALTGAIALLRAMIAPNSGGLIAVAGGGLCLALLALAWPATGRSRSALNGWIGGVLPVVTLLSVSLLGFEHGAWWAIGLVVLAAGLWGLGLTRRAEAARELPSAA